MTAVLVHMYCILNSIVVLEVFELSVMNNTYCCNTVGLEIFVVTNVT